MEKKYYFRGLGLGIIVTAVIMGIALSSGTKTREMTDEEVIARAKELGMTENTRLVEPSDEEGEEEPGDGGTAAAEPVKKDVAVKTEAELEKQEAESAKAEDSPASEEEAGTEQKPAVDTPEPAKKTTSVSSTETKPKADTNEMNKQEDNKINKQEGNETKSVTIASGDSSYTIAKKLEAAGVVSSASSYDTYLCEHGYDKKLRSGTFQIPAGATDEQIAKIVTGQ